MCALIDLGVMFLWDSSCSGCSLCSPISLRFKVSAVPFQGDVKAILPSGLAGGADGPIRVVGIGWTSVRTRMSWIVGPVRRFGRRDLTKSLGWVWSSGQDGWPDGPCSRAGSSGQAGTDRASDYAQPLKKCRQNLEFY